MYFDNHLHVFYLLSHLIRPPGGAYAKQCSLG